MHAQNLTEIDHFEVVFASCGRQEAFFKGHVQALRTLGGVPRSKIRYDNLKSAVAQVLGLNSARMETDRWIAFRSHFNTGTSRRARQSRLPLPERGQAQEQPKLGDVFAEHRRGWPP
ncbi:hypothetical protein [Streptomyces sp. NPDC002215]|uniref:hypothetical protein n=1 Tax=Streptomyces sp. NPDC002215 TaxID=3154412 RepID=UPI003325C401